MVGSTKVRQVQLSAAASVEPGAKRGFEFRGEWLAEGQMLKMLNTTANRDPAIFARPDVLGLRRANCRRQVLFAVQLHHALS